MCVSSLIYVYKMSYLMYSYKIDVIDITKNTK